MEARSRTYSRSNSGLLVLVDLEKVRVGASHVEHELARRTSEKRPSTKTGGWIGGQAGRAVKALYQPSKCWTSKENCRNSPNSAAMFRNHSSLLYSRQEYALIDALLIEQLICFSCLIELVAMRN